MTEPDDHRTDHLFSRRSAMQLLTALAGAGAFSGSAVADERDESETEGEENEDAETPDHPVGTEELLDYLAVRYGDILSDEDLEELTDDVAGNREAAQAMDGVDLENGDDMALVFEAYRGSY